MIQLAMNLGYVWYRILGATLVNLASIWPSFLMVVALGGLYTIYGGLTWLQAVFYGVGASIIGIIAEAICRLRRDRHRLDRLFLALSPGGMLSGTEAGNTMGAACLQNPT